MKMLQIFVIGLSATLATGCATIRQPTGEPITVQHTAGQTMLSARYGRPHYLAQDIDDSVVGGARIRVGDNVIDGSIATRLSDLRNTLAG